MTPMAWVGGRLATGLLDVTSDPAALDSKGFWVVVDTYEGELTCARFDYVRPMPIRGIRTGTWRGPSRDAWSTSLDEGQYVAGVEKLRAYVAAGEIYQANLCRVLSASIQPNADVFALAQALARGNPAPYASAIRLPDHGVHLASASPELFLRRRGC